MSGASLANSTLSNSSSHPTPKSQNDAPEPKLMQNCGNPVPKKDDVVELDARLDVQAWSGICALNRRRSGRDEPDHGYHLIAKSVVAAFTTHKV